MQTLRPSRWHLLNPQPSTLLDCGHIVILFWCAEGQRAASVIREGLAPNTARRVKTATSPVLPHFLNNVSPAWYFHLAHKWRSRASALVHSLVESGLRLCHLHIKIDFMHHLLTAKWLSGNQRCVMYTLNISCFWGGEVCHLTFRGFTFCFGWKENIWLKVQNTWIKSTL